MQSRCNAISNLRLVRIPLQFAQDPFRCFPMISKAAHLQTGHFPAAELFRPTGRTLTGVSALLFHKGAPAAPHSLSTQKGEPALPAAIGQAGSAWKALLSRFPLMEIRFNC